MGRIVTQIFQKPIYSHNTARLIDQNFSATPAIRQAFSFVSCQHFFIIWEFRRVQLGGFTSNKKTIAFVIIQLQITEGTYPQNGKANKGRSGEEIKANQ